MSPMSKKKFGQANRRTFIGEEINGWLVLEEVEPEDDNPTNAMDKFRSRMFRVIHQQTGFEAVKRLHGLYTRAPKMYSEWGNFKNRIGEQYGTYIVAAFTNDRLLIDKREPDHLWKAVCTETGDVQVLTYKQLKAIAKRSQSTNQ